MFYWQFLGGASFVDHFCFLCFVFDMLSCLFIAALWSPVEKKLIFWLSSVWCFIVICRFPIWCLGSGVVLDCIDSWSLPPYLQSFHTVVKYVYDLLFIQFNACLISLPDAKSCNKILFRSLQIQIRTDYLDPGKHDATVITGIAMKVNL